MKRDGFWIQTHNQLRHHDKGFDSVTSNPRNFKLLGKGPIQL